MNFNIADRDALILRRELSRGTVKAGEGLAGAHLPARRQRIRAQRQARLHRGPGQPRHRHDLDARGDAQPGQRLLPGMYVHVKYTAGSRPNTVLIPQKAVVKTPTGHVAWVVGEGNKVQRRDLVVGEWYQGDWIIERGLGAGESVVVEGLQRLQPGATVKPVPWSPRPAERQAERPRSATLPPRLPAEAGSRPWDSSSSARSWRPSSR